MKRYRSALMAGLLAMAVAVCDDDGTVTQPPPTVNVAPPNVEVNVPPTPPTVAPLTAMITPPAVEAGVGGMANFAVGTSGGSGDASWTCSTSDPAVATVEKTDTGCRATAVAGGGATITAAVTKGSETTNVAAQLTVSTTTDALILVGNISGDGDTDITGLKGTVTVDVNVERGNQTFERVALNVDGMEVAAEDFGTAPAADDAEQAVHTFMLSFDSDDYDSETGAVDYMNGEHSIQATLKVAGRDEVLMSNNKNVEFDNTDGVYVALSGLGLGAMNSGTGVRWYGGPAAALEIAALPVLYSGGYAMAVGIGEFCGADAASDSEAPFAFMPECEGTSNTNTDDENDPAGDTPTFTVDGEDTGVLNAGVFPLYLDFDGPSAPYFSPNPNNRENGWVNAMVDFGGEQDADDNENGWLTYNDDDDTGVGGYQPVLRYAEADNGSVEDAIAAAPLSLTNFPGESEIDAYCVVVSAVDALGNQSDLPDEDDGTCYMAGMRDSDTDDDTQNDATGYEELLEALDIAMTAEMVDDDAVTAAQKALADAGLLAGLDITPPGIEIDEKDRINVAAGLNFDFDIYDDENEDHNSELHSLAPLLVRIERRDPSDTECLAIGDAADVADGTGVLGQVDNEDDVECDDDPTALADGTAITFGETAPDTASHAYYTLSGAALDQAGNHSMVASHTFVFDKAAATATVPAAPAVEAGEIFEVASFLNDDLSIRDYYVTADFGQVGDITPIRLGVVHPTPVDAFDADMLTRRNFSVTADVDTYAGLQVNAAADVVVTLATVTVAVRDQADSVGTNDGTPSTTLTVEAPDDGFDADEDPFDVVFTSSAGTVGADPAQDVLCVAEDIDDCAGMDDAERETELEVVATAENEGAFSDPFDRVDFWVRDVNGASWMLGSDTSGDSGRVGGSGTDARNRTWTYSLDTTAAAIYMRTREAGFPRDEDGTDPDEHTVLAFGVNDDGVALVMEVDLTIDDGED